MERVKYDIKKLKSESSIFNTSNDNVNDIYKLIEIQINAEYKSWYLYMDMSRYFFNKKMNGLSKYFYKSGVEELGHGDKLVTFLQNRNVDYTLLPIDTIKITNETTMVDVVNMALNHEKTITSSLTNILDYSRSDKNGLVETVMLDYIKEQIDEEEKFITLLDMITIYSNDLSAMLLLDKEYGNM